MEKPLTESYILWQFGDTQHAIESRHEESCVRLVFFNDDHEGGGDDDDDDDRGE